MTEKHQPFKQNKITIKYYKVCIFSSLQLSVMTSEQCSGMSTTDCTTK